jgi:hypothetical protein
MEFYRYDITKYANMSDDSYKSSLSISKLFRIKLVLSTYKLHKETPKGYWIYSGSTKPYNIRSDCRWISKTAKKCYVYPTKKEALNAFLHRKKRQKHILNSILMDIDYGIHLGEQILNKL